MTHAPIFILTGSTASGKSAVALDIAQTTNAVIINCDSKQLYADIPIITAQPTPEEKLRAEHRLYGVIPASEHCSVGRWITMAKKEIDEVHAQGKIPLLVGGTGMYIKGIAEGFSPIPAVNEEIRLQVRQEFKIHGNDMFYKRLKRLDPVMASRLNRGDSQRVVRAMEIIRQTGISLAVWQEKPPVRYYDPARCRVFFLDSGKQQAYDNCDKRFHQMVAAGVVNEIEALKKQQLDPALPSMKAHGVPELLAYLQGEMTLEAAIEKAILNTRHYIKRQYTWNKHQIEGSIVLNGKDPKSAANQAIKDIQAFS